jgi:FlaG/FlaF family flagellin (archaellin)
MAQNINNVHIGPARIWLGVTTPASALPPTMVGHTAGVPATGTEVGHTEGPSEVIYARTYNDIVTEQAFGTADIFVSDEKLTLNVTLKERTYQNLRALFDNIGNVDDGAKTLMYAGGSVVTPLTQSLFLSSPRRDNPAKFEVFMIYKAIQVNPAQFVWGRANQSTMKLQFRGLADGTRTPGDQLFQFYREK